MVCYGAHVKRFQWWHTWEFSDFDFLNFLLLQMEFVVRKRSWFGIKRKKCCVIQMLWCWTYTREVGKWKFLYAKFPIVLHIEANILCILNKLKVTRKVKIVLSNSSWSHPAAAFFCLMKCEISFVIQKMSWAIIQVGYVHWIFTICIWVTNYVEGWNLDVKAQNDQPGKARKIRTEHPYTKI